MKRFLVGMALLALLSLVGDARADSFKFSYKGSSSDPGLSGSGTLTATAWSETGTQLVFRLIQPLALANGAGDSIAPLLPPFECAPFRR